MDGRIPNRSTSPLHGLRTGAARTAPLHAPGPGIAGDALALNARAGAGPLDPARAAAARQAAEALWAMPAEPRAAEAPAAADAPPTDTRAGAWGGAGAGAEVAQDLADVNDVRFGAAFGPAAAGKLAAAAGNIQWHWKLAGFGGADGALKAAAYLERVGDDFEKTIAALEQADPLAHARWARVAGPILALGDRQTNATAVVLFERARKTGDWGPLEDLGRRAAHFQKGAAQQDAGALRAGLAARAASQVAANAPLERQALAALAPAERATYEQVRKALGDDPHAQLALQLLAIDGKLAGARGRDERTLVAALGGVATQPLAPGIDRRELLAALVRETATPTAITQREGTWTCTVTSAQIMVAIAKPADYVRIVAGLAAPSGRARLVDGEEMRRVAGSEGPDLTGRTVSSRLWQAALMDHANGADRYDPKLDLSVRADGSTYKGQVGAQSQERLFAGVTGRAGEVIGGAAAEGDGAAALARIKASLAAGEPVPATYLVRAGVGHAIMITGAADGMVTYADPMGLVKRVPEAEFQAKLFLARLAD